MSGELGSCDRSRHRKAIFQQRQIERCPVKGDKNGALGEVHGKLVEDRVLFMEIAHEELLDLQAAGIPPRETDQECVGSRTAGKPRSFGVEEQPFRWVSEGALRAPRMFDIPGATEEFQN